jgi:hypothetical protein
MGAWSDGVLEYWKSCSIAALEATGRDLPENPPLRPLAIGY